MPGAPNVLDQAEHLSTPASAGRLPGTDTADHPEESLSKFRTPSGPPVTLHPWEPIETQVTPDRYRENTSDQREATFTQLLLPLALPGGTLECARVPALSSAAQETVQRVAALMGGPEPAREDQASSSVSSSTTHFVSSESTASPYHRSGDLEGGATSASPRSDSAGRQPRPDRERMIATLPALGEVEERERLYRYLGDWPPLASEDYRFGRREEQGHRRAHTALPRDETSQYQSPPLGELSETRSSIRSVEWLEGKEFPAGDRADPRRETHHPGERNVDATSEGSKGK